MFCADSVVNLLLNSGGKHHIEFKGINGSFIYGANGELSAVPDSRSAIFKDRSLGLTEKNELMRFSSFDESRRIRDEDLESPFIEFLNKQRLPSKRKSMILAMADYDQEKPELCKNLLKTKDGIESLALFHSSVGRYINALGAMIYPIFGQGELPQAFAVVQQLKVLFIHASVIYHLFFGIIVHEFQLKSNLLCIGTRLPVIALLLSKENGDDKGVRLASGQEILSQHLVINPSVTASNMPEECSESDDRGEVIEKVARGICIIRGSIKSNFSNLLVIFPPRSLCSEQVSSIRLLQLGSGLSVCPSGMSVLYLSTLCDDAIQGKNSLHASMNFLVAAPLSENPQDTSSKESENVGDAKPTLLWKATFVQELEKASSRGAITSCPAPDGNLDYRNILESSEKLFHQIYQEDFFPKPSASEKTEDDDDET
ncbi:hypothetical protein MKW92_044648 [Papaver armeniacum]|nr:hypothetical protein MKW92_044648 [Papaver armeniacum]